MLPLNEVRISETEQWQARHFKSIWSAYNRSPFFEYYADELKAIYQQRFDRLADWNLSCLDWLQKKLEWPAEIRFTDSADSLMVRADGKTTGIR